MLGGGVRQKENGEKKVEGKTEWVLAVVVTWPGLQERRKEREDIREKERSGWRLNRERENRKGRLGYSRRLIRI